MTYTKIKRDEFVYYIENKFIYGVKCSHTDLLASSTYALDCSTNTLVKCRKELETIFDIFIELE